MELIAAQDPAYFFLVVYPLFIFANIMGIIAIASCIFAAGAVSYQLFQIAKLIFNED